MYKKRQNTYMIQTKDSLKREFPSIIMKNVEKFFGTNYYKEYDDWGYLIYPVLYVRPGNTLITGRESNYTTKFNNFTLISYYDMLILMDKELNSPLAEISGLVSGDSSISDL